LEIQKVGEASARLLAKFNQHIHVAAIVVEVVAKYLAKNLQTTHVAPSAQALNGDITAAVDPQR
jgi:hypothetical protein